MTRTSGDLRFDVPLYTIEEAARFLAVPTSTFRNWSQGYEVRPPGRPKVQGEPILTIHPMGGKQPRVPFVGLVEGMVAAAFRKAGVSMQHIRRALHVLQDELGLEHALASKKLYTDGSKILYDYATKHGPEDLLTVVVGGQRVFTPVIQGYLRRITYAKDTWAERLVLPITTRDVVEVDPRRSFGQPIFIRGGVRIEDALDRFLAGESLTDVAADFGLEVSDVEDVIRATHEAA